MHSQEVVQKNQDWKKTLKEAIDITWPDPSSPASLCDQSGECCRGAAQYAPWNEGSTLDQARLGDSTARAFLNQFVPYSSLEDAQQHAPAALESALLVVADRNQNKDDLVLYRCRYLQGKNVCQIYEDRPQLCREFPETPFGGIPSCCGYYSLAQECSSRIEDLKNELEALKNKTHNNGQAK